MRARSVTNGVAVDVLAEGERQHRLRRGEGLGVDDVAQRDQLALPVRHLDADGRRAADALDADRLRLQRQREIVAEVHDLGVLHAGRRLELERRDDRAGMIRGDFAFDGELAAALFDEVPDLEELLVHLVVDRVLLRPGGEQVDGRQQIVVSATSRVGFLRRSVCARRPRDLRLRAAADGGGRRGRAGLRSRRRRRRRRAVDNRGRSTALACASAYSANGSGVSCFDSASAALRRSAFVTLRI